MTRASVVQPSRPAETRHRSVDQRSFGAAATDSTASMRGRMPTGRLARAGPVLPVAMAILRLMMGKSRRFYEPYPLDFIHRFRR